MWKRFSLYDLKVIGHYLGILILFSAGLMVVPWLTALVFQEWDPFYRYLYSIGIALVVGSLLRFCRIRHARLNRQQALAVVGLAWIVLGLFCSIPLYFSGHYTTYLDALFDGVSGLTTTGAALVVDLDHLSYADNMFRFVMHLLGGLGLIVVALSLGVFGKRAGSSLYTSEARNEHVVPNVIQTTTFISKITAWFIGIATAIVAGLMLASGIEPVRALLQALWVSISGFVTGGFTPMQQSILYYHSFPIEFLLMVLMLLGTISFAVYSKVLRGHLGDFFRDIETRTAVLWLGAMVTVFVASLATSTLFSDIPDLLRRGTFMVISVFTTTGFSVITVNQLVTVLTSGAFMAIAIVMAVGGGAGSTAGGIKIYRVGVIAKSIISTIKEAVSPDSAAVVVTYNHLGRRVLTANTVKEAMTIFILYVITYVIGTLVGIAHGYDAQQAMFESIAMTSNGGLITGIATPGMPATLELFYILQMWVGRLEFVTLLAFVAQLAATLIPRRGWKDRLFNGDSQRAKTHTPLADADNERTFERATASAAAAAHAEAAASAPSVASDHTTPANQAVAPASQPSASATKEAI